MTVCGKLSEIFCVYQSVRHISVKNKKLAITYWLCLFAVLMYVIFYTIVYEKGYQRKDDVIGAVSTKTKGSGSIDTNSHIQGTFDSIDLIYPSIETNSLFIATAITNTPNQIQSDCIGNSDSDECVNDSDCNEGEYNEWGRYNGICGINGYCQIYGWCPIENDTIKYRIENVGNFTVFIKVEGRFDEFKITRSNTDDRYGTGKPTWDYNLFTMDSLVGMSTHGLTVDDVADRGAILLANVNWDCDFDSKKGIMFLQYITDICTDNILE